MLNTEVLQAKLPAALVVSTTVGVAQLDEVSSTEAEVMVAMMDGS